MLQESSSNVIAFLGGTLSYVFFKLTGEHPIKGKNKITAFLTHSFTIHLLSIFSATFISPLFNTLGRPEY